MSAPTLAPPQPGTVVSARKRRWRGRLATAALLAPLGAVFVAGFAVPLLNVARFSFDRFDAARGQIPAWSLDQYRLVFTTELYRDLLVRTFGLALTTVFLCAVLAYPLALAIVRGPRRLRPPILVAVVLPLLVSVVVKTFGWSVLLGSGGALQQALDATGLPVKLLFSKTGVVIGLVHTYLPFMVLSLIGSLNRLDPRVEEAAASLGSPPMQVFRKVTFPQTLGGVATGSVLVFVLSASAFVTPQILGGGKVTTLVNVIYDQATAAQNWPLASAAGVILLIVTLVVLSAHALVVRRATHD